MSTVPIGLSNIHPENVLFCYRDGDTDSLEVANYYISQREVPSENLLALPCSSSFTSPVINESEFESTILDPIQQFLSAVSLHNDILVIVLGYNIPHGYYSDDNPNGQIIAIPSRLQRVRHEKSYNIANPLYDRRGDWKFFDGSDAEVSLITAVLDGPTVATVKTLIDRATAIMRSPFVTGRIYVDPYGKKDTLNQLAYQEEVLDFLVKEVPKLGIRSSQTSSIAGSGDPMVQFLSGDSFYWGWFTPRFNRKLFMNRNEPRVFLYNADEDSGADIKSLLSVDSSDPWCNLAMQIDPGYAACAGSISAPGETSYLRPRPFFDSLHQGSTLGEAFLFASPTLSWKIMLIGDPLLSLSFPAPPNFQRAEGSLIDNDEVIRLVKEDLEEAFAYARRQSRLLAELCRFHIQSHSIPEKLNLTRSLAFWHRSKSGTTRSALFYRSVASWVEYIKKTTGQSLSGWLVQKNEKISRLLAEIQVSNVPRNLRYPAGHWQYDFQYTHVRRTLERLHFELEIAIDKDFTKIVVSRSSHTSQEGWSYETEPNLFVDLGVSGFPSNLSSRRVRYSSTESDYLRTTELYYIRYRVVDSDGLIIEEENWRIDPKQMIIKR